MTFSTRARAAIAAIAIGSAALTGCSAQPRVTPYDPGIPEARAEAQAHIDDLRSRLAFSDQVVVLGSAQRDSCGAAHNWWFDDVPAGYRCWMKWTAIAVIPAAATPEEVAAALDDEMAALDFPYFPGGMVRSLVSGYGGLDGPFSVGGHDGTLRFSMAAEPFRAAHWPTPSIRGASEGDVSGSGDLSEITASDIEETGASQIIEISLSVEYWNTEGIDDLSDELPPDPVNLVYGSETSTYAFKLAGWAPAEAPEACLTDSMIDQSSISRVDEPFPYLRFALLPEAQGLDSERIRDCVIAQLTSGTLVALSPYQ